MSLSLLPIITLPEDICSNENLQQLVGVALYFFRGISKVSDFLPQDGYSGIHFMDSRSQVVDLHIQF